MLRITRDLLLPLSLGIRFLRSLKTVCLCPSHGGLSACHRLFYSVAPRCQPGKRCQPGGERGVCLSLIHAGLRLRQFRCQIPSGLGVSPDDGEARIKRGSKGQAAPWELPLPTHDGFFFRGCWPPSTTFLPKEQSTTAAQPGGRKCWPSSSNRCGVSTSRYLSCGSTHFRKRVNYTWAACQVRGSFPVKLERKEGRSKEE